MGEDDKRGWKPPADGRKGAASGRRRGERKVIARNARTESSKRWIERQLTDPYVKRAKEAGFRARAAFKLLELDEKAKLFRPGQRVVDLGCAPGGWLQVAVEKGAREVVGIDLLPIAPVGGVHIVEGDVNDPEAIARMMEGLSGPPDLILSDMAANTTGHRQTDHLRTIALAEMALDFALQHLRPGGHFVAKLFQGGAGAHMLRVLRANFQSVRHIKPPASRAGSPEIYVVAKGFRGRRPQESAAVAKSS